MRFPILIKKSNSDKPEDDNRNDTLEKAVVKFKEEAKELIEAIGELDHNHIMEEAQDVQQILNRIFMIESDILDINKANETHIKKIEDRKWIISGYLELKPSESMVEMINKFKIE